MTVSAGVLREHLSYTAWASRHLVHAVENLPHDQLTYDFQTADRSILGTLVHIFAADRVWLGRVQGKNPAAFVSETDFHLSVFQTEWPQLHGKWLEWAAGLTDESVLQEVAYRDLKGNPYSARSCCTW